MHSIKITDITVVEPYQRNVALLVSLHCSICNRWVSCAFWCYEIELKLLQSLDATIMISMLDNRGGLCIFEVHGYLEIEAIDSYAI